MIIDLNRKAVCICPYCSEMTKKNISIFEIQKNSDLIIECNSKHCGEELMTIIEKKGMYKVSLQCPLCLEEHQAKIDIKKFFRSGGAVLKCPIGNETIAIIGTDKYVESKIEEFDLFDDESDDAHFDILYDIVDKLNDFNEQSHILCKCGSNNITLDINKEKIILACAECGAFRELDIDERTLIDLMNVNAVYIR